MSLHSFRGCVENRPGHDYLKQDAKGIKADYRMNLRSLDLNLLVVFDAVYGELNITRAGTKVGLSQSSVSNALTRLRGHLGDELFVRGSGKMRPTARATELAAPIHDMLLSLQQILDPKQFDMSTEKRTFTIAAVDYVGVVLAPKLAHYVGHHAPNINVRIISDLGNGLDLLDRAEIDFAVGVFNDLPDRFSRQHLVDDSFRCMMSSQNPYATGKPTIEQYVNMRHLLVSLKGDAHGFVDDDLKRLGLKRRVAMTVTSFAAASGIVEASDLVLTAPSIITERFASSKSFVFDLPDGLPNKRRKLELIWHERLSNHPAHEWFRKTLTNIASDISV